VVLEAVLEHHDVVIGDRAADKCMHVFMISAEPESGGARQVAPAKSSQARGFVQGK
jgi:hypothetical protein